MSIVNSSCNPLSLALSTSSAASSFTEPADFLLQPLGAALVLPTTVGFHQISPGGAVENSLLVLPIGTTAQNLTFLTRVYGWREILTTTGTLINAQMLLEVTCTTGNKSADSSILASAKYCDTIVYSTGDSTFRPYSAANNSTQGFVVDLMGCKYITIAHATTGGSPATAMNALYAKVS